MIPSYFPMDSNKRCLASLIFLVSCIALTVLSTSMLTQEWTIVKPVRVGLNISIKNTVSPDTKGNRFQGLIYFGLFEGRKILNYGFGDRIFDLKIVCVSKLEVCMFSTKENSTERVRDLQDNLYLKEPKHSDITGRREVRNDSLMIFSLWVVTVVSISLAGMFAFIGAVFSILNLFRGSVEVLTGFLGLYLWNGCGVLLCVVCITSWLTHYFVKFRRNVMTREELEQHWVSEYRSCMGYSFYMVIVAALLFLLNVALVTLVIKQPWVDRKLRADLRKKLSNGRYATPPRVTKKVDDTISMSV